MGASVHKVTLRPLSTGSPVAAARVTRRSPQELLEEEAARQADQAREEGLERGRQDAVAAGRAALDAAVDRLDGAREEAAQALTAQAIELGVGIARTLLRTELDAGRYDLETIVREALAASGAGRARVRVHVAPADAERLATTPFREGTEVVADPALRRGDVHVETERGLLVREIDETLEAIRTRLTEELAG